MLGGIWASACFGGGLGGGGRLETHTLAVIHVHTGSSKAYVRSTSCDVMSTSQQRLLHCGRWVSLMTSHTEGVIYRLHNINTIPKLYKYHRNRKYILYTLIVKITCK